MAPDRATGASPGIEDPAAAQAALRRVAALAAAGEPPEAVFGAVTEEASALLDGALMALLRFEEPTLEAVVAAQTGDFVPVGLRLPPFTDDAQLEWLRSGRTTRIDDYTSVPDSETVRALGVVSTVAVPVTVDGGLWGWLSANSRTGPLPAITEERLVVFAEIVAAAIASAAARARERALAAEQAALLRVAALVTEGADETAVFDAVAVEAAGLVGDEPTTLVRYEGRRTFTVLATHEGPAPVGTRFTVPEDDAGTSAEVLRTLRPARRDHYGDIADRSFSNRGFGVGSSVTVPILVHGRLWGSLGTLNEGRRLPTGTEERLAQFAELVATALANVQARAELRRFAAEQAALRRVAELAAGGAPHPAVLRAVVLEAALLLHEAVVGLRRSEPSGASRRVEARGGHRDGGPPVPGTPPEEEALAREVLATGEPARIDDGERAGADPSGAGGSLWGAAAPIRVEGETWGVLVATAQHRPLPRGAEDGLAHFAQVAATAVAAARARDALRRLAREQAALRRVAELVARGAALDEVFEAVAAEASNLLGDAAANLFRYDPDGFATVVATCRSSVPVGLRTPTDGDTAGARLLRAGRPLRFPTLDGTASADLARALRVRALVTVPITVEGRTWGGLSTTTADDLPVDAEDVLSEFAGLAAAAIADAENRTALRASRARVVATADETRRRLQRDVHDGAQQRLVQTVLTLRLGLEAIASGEDPSELVQEALRSAERATVELRDIVHGILPASLTRGGLRLGIESLIAGLNLPVELDVSALPAERLPGELEVTAYFVVAEALTNVAKHARATRVRVTVVARADALTVEVVDDGVGGADPTGAGLTGLSDRVEAMNGTLRLTSPRGRGTALRVVLPRPRDGGPPR